jgi:Carboxypeptidase regulatory-like domain
MRSRLKKTLSIASLFLIAACQISIAQFSQRGSITGVVTESSGAVVPNAAVTLLDPGRNQKTAITSDAGRHYEFSQLVVGNNQVSVEVRSVTSHFGQARTATLQQAGPAGSIPNKGPAMPEN